MSIKADESVSLPPDPSRVMDGLRDTGYEFNTAIADIVDNSIAANASIVSILLQLTEEGEPFVAISDNGSGMNKDGLLNAMRYGSRKNSDPSSLSKFGLGLKTASTAFCKRLSVISRDAEENIARKFTWDLDHIAEKGEWSLLMSSPSNDELSLLEEIAGAGSGTVVVWEKIDRLLKDYKRLGDAKNALKKREEDLQFHLSAVYERFLSNDSTLKIFLNSTPIAPWDPFCKEEPVTENVASETFGIVLPDGRESSLSLNAYVIPRKDSFSTTNAATAAKVSNDFQGFYIYRENRLIHYGDWLGMFSKEPHGTLLRVDMSFDHTLDDVLNVDIKKSRVQMSEELFDVIKNTFMPAPRRAADERYRKGQRKVVGEKTKNAHDSANRSIDEKAPSVESSHVTVTDEKTGEVVVENKNGKCTHHIKIHTSDVVTQPRIIPVSNIEDGNLWRPVIQNGKHAIEINEQHPFYQKVYYPVIDEEVMVTGMDSLLWALGEAELSTLNQDTIEQYEDMRISVSRNLKKLLRDLPEPSAE